MKQCPKCKFSCADDDVICKNCGYLFTPDGYGDGVPPQDGYNNPNGVPPQGGYNNPNGVPPQGGYNNPNGVPPQGGYNNPNGVPPQGGYNNPNGVPPQGGYNNPNGVPPQDGYNNPNGVPPQGGYNNPNGVPPQGGYNNPNGVPPQGGYNNSWGNPYNNAQNYQEPKNNGMSIASLVLGIVGVVFSCCSGIGVIPGIISFILGIISMKNIKKSQGAQKGQGMALAGTILSIVAIVLSVYFIITLIISIKNGDYTDFWNAYMNAIKQYENNASSSSPL